MKLTLPCLVALLLLFASLESGAQSINAALNKQSFDQKGKDEFKFNNIVEPKGWYSTVKPHNSQI